MEPLRSNPPSQSPEDIFAYLKSDTVRERSKGLMLVGRNRMYAALGQAVRLLNDPDPDVRALAAWALDQLASPVTVPALIEALYDREFAVRSNAGWALVHLAQRTVSLMVVADVVDVLRDHQNQDARQMAFLVLNHIGDDLCREAIRLYWRE